MVPVLRASLGERYVALRLRIPGRPQARSVLVKASDSTYHRHFLERCLSSGPRRASQRLNGSPKPVLETWMSR